LKTLYERLGIGPQASPKLIQRAFYRLVKKFDPYNPENQGKADAYSKYLDVHDAYHVLSDPDARRLRKASVSTQACRRSERDAGCLARRCELSALRPIQGPHAGPASAGAERNADAIRSR